MATTPISMHASTLSRHAEAIWQAIAPDLPGFTVEILPSVDSTSTELMRRVRAGLVEPVLLAADEQTAGRGRMGSGWHSRAGHSLTFSLALPLAPSSWAGLSLAVGISLANSLHPDLRLKWPNDLWLQQRKLGGILVETASTGKSSDGGRFVVVGVGLNIARPEAAAIGVHAASKPVAPMPPAGLSELLTGLTAGEALERVAAPLVRDIRSFESLGFAAFAQRFAALDALRDQVVSLSDGSQGTACGVDGQGGLLVMTADGMRTVTSSEVGVRPC